MTNNTKLGLLLLTPPFALLPMSLYLLPSPATITTIATCKHLPIFIHTISHPLHFTLSTSGLLNLLTSLYTSCFTVTEPATCKAYWRDFFFLYDVGISREFIGDREYFFGAPPIWKPTR
ncbi:hypothetical protein E2C01_051794 [Portunus trituberculatus]|uniref:Uncharacterized protein n=1 Tax=Portunus trituberculatus TaxID=210409 RepID=A0A5B7GJT4_PORTR|nr:hypothetical protein [Portunus trituberculatus]